MVQLKYAFGIIIPAKRITISQSFYLIKYEITENIPTDSVKQLHLGVDILASKSIFPIKRFDIHVYGINIIFFIIPN